MKEPERLIQKEQLITQGDRITLGLSGGADSVCLFFLCKKWQETYRFTWDVIHVEHGMRQETSLRDAAFVKNLCETYQIPCQIFHVDAPRYAQEHKMSEEEAARHLRYDIFFRHGAAKIALAHHADDNAETVMMHLLRGTGMKGLCGMLPKTDVNGHELIRPLLTVDRKSIEVFLQEQGYSYCTDETNADSSYTRNYVRNEVFPLLQNVNAKATEHINQTANMVRRYYEDLSTFAREVLESVSDSHHCIRIGALRNYPLSVQAEVIHRWLREQTNHAKDITYYHIEEIQRILREENTPKELCLPHQYVIKVRYGLLSAEKDIRQNSKQIAALKGEEKRIPVLLNHQLYEVQYGHMHFSFQITENTNETPPKDDFAKWMDYDTIGKNLALRTREKDDYICLRGGKKKTFARFCIDEKIPREKRNTIVLLCDGHHVLWVVGYRLSESAKVSEQTKRVLSVTISRTD